MANFGFGLLRGHTIVPPILSAPSGNINILTPITLSSSAFQIETTGPYVLYPDWDADANFLHTSSDWQIWSGAGGSGSCYWSLMASTSALTSVTIPANTIKDGNSSYPRVRYHFYEEALPPSVWSDGSASFTGQSPLVATPSITTPASLTVLYTPNRSFTMYGSEYIDPNNMSTYVSADWIVVNSGATQTLWSSYGNTTPPTSGISVPLSNTYPTVIYVAVRYHGTNGATSDWSYSVACVGYNIEYCIPSSPNLSTAVFKVATTPAFGFATSPWNDWMNANAVWVSPGGDKTTYIADYMPITFPLNISDSGTYYFNYLWDNAGQIVINGGGYVNYILVNFDFTTYGCNFTNGGQHPGTPCTAAMNLTAGTRYLITVTGYNAPNQIPPGSTLTYAEVNDWANNPAGMCCVITGPTGFSGFNLTSLVGQPAPYCSTGTYYNGECHCFTP